MKTISKPSKYLFICIIILAIIFLFRGFTGRSKIKTNHKVVCSLITSMYYSKGWYVDVEYNTGLKKIETFKSCTIASIQNYKRGINNILIVFEKADPLNSELLESRNDFLEYNILKEDTAGIICPYLGNVNL